MGYLPGFSCDIFISHAQADNKTFPGSSLLLLKGWVDTFEEKLKKELTSRLGDQVCICRSRESNPFDLFPFKDVKGSALFVALRSSQYSQSESCRQELEEFQSEVKKSGASLFDHCRVFHVQLEGENKFFLPGTAFEFHKLGFRLIPGISGAPSFESRLGELADALERSLKRLKDENLPLPPTNAALEDFLSSLKTKEPPPAPANSADDFLNTLKAKNLLSSLKTDAKEPSPPKPIPPVDDFLSQVNNVPKPWLADKQVDLLSAIEQTSARVTAAADEALVFVCYAREDKTFTHELATILKARGVRVWIDLWDIPAGADWDQSIDDALSKCDRLLIVLSPSSVASPQVRSELNFAFDENKTVIPVLHKACRIPRRLRLTQRVDFSSVSLDDEAEMNQLLKALSARSQ